MKTIAVRFEDDLSERLEAMATVLGVTQVAIIREAVDGYLSSPASAEKVRAALASLDEEHERKRKALANMLPEEQQQT